MPWCEELVVGPSGPMYPFVMERTEIPAPRAITLARIIIIIIIIVYVCII